MIGKGPCVALLVLVWCRSCFSDETKVTDKEYAAMPALFHMDNFDNCLLYGDEALYCRMTYELHPLNPDNTTAIWNTVKTVSSKPTNYRHDRLRHTVCVPETCPEIHWTSVDDPQISKGLKECYDRKYKSKGLQGDVTALDCEGVESPYPIRNVDIMVAALFFLYVAFIVVASVYEGAARFRTTEEYEQITGTFCGRILSAFSIPRNWMRLKTVNYDDPEVQSLCCIQGIRFYNMICVIMAHTVMVNLASLVSNPKYTENIYEKLMNTMIGNGGYVVQTFFMISAWLLTYHMFKAFDGKRELKLHYLVLAYINRYIRLTPMLAIVVVFHATWIVQLGRGPMWQMFVGEEYRKCNTNWWVNILYLNDFINSSDMCLAQTWYMSVDNQFFIIALGIIWLMLKYPKKIYLILGFMTVGHIVSMWLMIYINNFEPIIRPFPENVYNLKIVEQQDWQILLGSSYSNFAGLITGLAFGYIYYKYRNTEIAFFKSNINVVFWFACVWIGGLGIIVVPGAIMFSKGFEHNVIYSACYGCISRLIFSVSIGMVIWGFTQKIGGPFRWACTFPPLYVLGRLTYGAYLTHTIFSRIKMGLARSPVFLDDFIISHQIIAEIVLAYITSLVLTLLVELPMSDIQKLMMPSDSKKQSKKNEETSEINNTKKDR